MTSPTALQGLAKEPQFSDSGDASQEQALQEQSDRYTAQVLMNPELKRDLQWWAMTKLWTLGTAICTPSSPTLVLELDASQKGWGARCMETSTGVLWSVTEAQHHINYLELLAAFLALKTFASNQKDLILDNISAVTCINEKSGTHSTQLCNLVLQIWEWCIQKGIMLQAEHLLGNVVADIESWTIRDRCDWMINPKIFQQSLGLFEIDLFASRLTKQLPRYYSWRPDPGAKATDAFLHHWTPMRGFANPPWCIISRCLSQIKQQQARALLIMPLRPCQPWFLVVLGMLQDYPRQLPPQEDLILSPSNQEFIMQQGTPTLVAWPSQEILLFTRSFCTDFRIAPLFMEGQNQHKLQLFIWQIGVSNGIEIPLLDL